MKPSKQCESHTENPRRYSLAFVKADGSWDIVQTFLAADDDAANDWASLHYSGQEWFVLDERLDNINGGQP